MSTIIKSKFRFHKAGQGGFYSGRIKASGNRQFTFVYDCGTTSGASELTTEIDKWYMKMNNNGNTSLDLLVLSHLDADHINKVLYLLRKIGHCKRVILPFLTPLERLWLYLKQEDGDLDNEYTNFIINPTIALNEAAQIDEIVYMRGSDETGGQYTSPEISPDSGNDNDLPLLMSPVVSDNISGDAEIENAKQALSGAAGQVKFKQDNTVIYAGRFWEFYFYDRPQDKKAEDAYRSFVNTKLNIDVNKTPFTQADLEKMLGDNGLLGKIRKAFKAAFGDMNTPGLVVLHGPHRPHSSRIKTKNKRSPLFWFYKRMRPPMGVYTLLNGDINLNNISYPQYINDRIMWVRVFQVPHHGSGDSWQTSVLSDLHWAFMVLQFGWGNKHKHPFAVVMQDIKRKSYWKKKLVTQYKRFTYRINSVFNLYDKHYGS